NSFDSLDLGPAKIIVQEMPYVYSSGNAVVLQPISGSSTFNYFIYTASKGGLTKKGQAKAGDMVELGWMGLQMRILKYLPQAREEIKFIQLERPAGPATTSALLVEFNGKDYWLALNSNTRIFNDSSVFMISYNNRRIDVGFSITLENFTVGRYQGTMRAASYASDVMAEGYGPAHISMNEPLKHNGFTFYQASFQENERGQPTSSILSVNRDPGRWIKYLGSFLIVLGSVVMFYFKRYRVKIFSKIQEVAK
ncbi:MAG: cytochrome c biogenesis protein ResB, partial [Bdellovibrionota bacterium]